MKRPSVMKRLSVVCSALTAGSLMVSGAGIMVMEDSYSTFDKKTKSLRITAATSGSPTLNLESGSRAYLFFDLAEADAQVKARRVIRSARLRFFFSAVKKAGEGVRVYSAKPANPEESWSERKAGPAPGVDKEIGALKPEDVVAKQFASLDVTEVVRGWVADMASNHGFVLEAGAGTSARVPSKEGSTLGVPAILDIEYGDDSTVVGDVAMAKMASDEGRKAVWEGGLAGQVWSRALEVVKSVEGLDGVWNGIVGRVREEFFKLLGESLAASKILDSLKANQLAPTISQQARVDGTGLSVGATTAVGRLTYQWYADGQAIEGATGASYDKHIKAGSSYFCRVSNGVMEIDSAPVAVSEELALAGSKARMVSVKGGILPDDSEMAGVRVPDFEMSKYEVTWAEWKAVRDWSLKNGYSFSDSGNGSVSGKGLGENSPVFEVYAGDALIWCNARSEMEGLTPVYMTSEGEVMRKYGSGRWDSNVKWGRNGYRIPLEVEWEWAARGGLSSKGFYYSGSDNVVEVFSDSAANRVGTKRGNELGLFDMSGGVPEFVFGWSDYSPIRMRDRNYDSEKHGIMAAEGVARRSPGGVVDTSSQSGLRVCRNVADPSASYGRVEITKQPVGGELTVGETSKLLKVEASGGGLTYQWYFNGDKIVGETSDSLSVRERESGYYHVRVMNPLGYEELGGVQYLGKPGSFSADLSNFELRAGTPSGSAQGGEFRYQWLKDGVVVEGATSPAFSPKASGKYSVRVANDFGTTESKSVEVSSEDLLPRISSFHSSGFLIQAEVESSREGGVLSYQWLKDGVVVEGATSPAFSPKASGKYSVRVTDDFGMTESEPVEVSSEGLRPRISSFDISGSLIQVAVESSREGGGLSYQWWKDGFLLEGAMTREFTLTENGEYWVRVTDSFGTVESERVRFVRAEMVTVAGGTLPSGSELADEVVGDFQIGKYEVTLGEWKGVRDWAVDHGYDLAGVGGGGGPSHPVVGVSWYDVVKWCNARSEKEGKVAVYEANGGVYRSGEFGKDGSSAVTMKSGANGYRLPLEKEWEWAARGGVSSEGYIFSGSNVAGEVAWTDENSPFGPKAVGGKKANELGLFDMSGNAWEWVWDSAQSSSRRIRGGTGYIEIFYYPGSSRRAEIETVSNRAVYFSPATRYSISYDNNSYGSSRDSKALGFRVALSSGQ